MLPSATPHCTSPLAFRNPFTHRPAYRSLTTARFLLLFLLACATLPLAAQKIKLKNDQILVDKVPQYTVVQTKKGNMFMAEWPHYDIVDNDGNVFLAVRDTTFRYRQLPHESEPRFRYRAFTVYSPKLDRMIMVPRRGANFPKTIMYYLAEVNYFVDMDLTHEEFDAFAVEMKEAESREVIATLPVADSTRRANNQWAVATFGEINPRKPDDVKVVSRRIYDGREQYTPAIGRFLQTGKGSYAITYDIMSAGEMVIGKVSVIPGEQLVKYWFVEGEERGKDLRFSKTEWAALIQNEGYLTPVAHALVLYGYL